MPNVSHFDIDGIQYDVAPAMPPTVGNGTLTIQKNGTNVQTFTANQSSNATANITVPTKVSELTNDSGYTTNTGTVTQVKVGNTAYNPSSGVVSLPAYPTVPTVNNATLTIQKNGTNVQTFTANSSTDKTANITVPTKVSELTNDSGYTTNTGTVTQVKVGNTAYNPSSGVVSLPAYPTDTNNRRGFYGTCATAAATAAKVVTLSNTAGWELVAGTIVGIKFTNTNTAGSATLNVNSSGAKNIWYNGAKYTGTEARITGWAGHVIYFMYDGTYWCFLNNDQNYINTNTTYSSGTGLSLSGTTFSVNYGTAAGTACQGNDSRLSNSRTPTAHASTATTYGIGNASNYGHVKLADTYNGTSGANTGVGASSKAVGDLASWCNDNLAHSATYQSDLAVQCAWLKTTDNHFIGFRWSDRKILIDGTVVGSF